MTIEFTGEVHEFSFDTAYFTVHPQEYHYACETKKEILRWAETLPKRVRAELDKMGGGIIWWRIRPEYEHTKIGCDIDKHPSEWTDEEMKIGANYFCWRGYARFATSPSLPEETVTRLTDSEEMYRKKISELRAAALAALTEAA